MKFYVPHGEGGAVFALALPVKLSSRRSSALGWSGAASGAVASASGISARPVSGFTGNPLSACSMKDLKMCAGKPPPTARTMGA